MSIKKNKKKLTTTLAVIVTFCVLSGIYFVFFFNPSKPSLRVAGEVNYEAPTDEQKQAGSDIKEDSINNNTASKPGSSGTDRASDPVAQDSGKSRVDSFLASKNQNGNILHLGFSIGAVTNSGTCVLVLQKNDVTLPQKTTDVQALAGSSTCKGFDIPVSQLSAGTWQILMHFENDSIESDVAGSVVVN